MPIAGCDKAESVASQSIDRAASAAADKSREVAERAERATKKKLSELGEKAGSYVDDKLKALMTRAEDGTLEARIREGNNSAVDIARIARTMRGAVKTDVTLLPIYRSAGDAAAVDAEIAAMPRAEVIDGVTVGFKRVRTFSLEEKVDEDAYLVLWRADDKIIGFVYQKRMRIDVDTLVKETPKLMRLIAG